VLITPCLHGFVSMLQISVFYGMATNITDYTVIVSGLQRPMCELRAIASKRREQLQQEGIVKNDPKAFTLETELSRMILEQIEGDVTDHGEVLRSFIKTDAGSIFAKDDIHRPVKGVFDRPVGTSGVQDAPGIGWQAGHIVVLDNAMMESFFATLHAELTELENFPTRATARVALFDFIEVFYNR
jgi:hypothetical protein